MKVRITQYGYPDDPNGDSLTRAQIGDHDNKLTTISCALTAAARKAFGTTKGLDAYYLLDFGFVDGVRFIIICMDDDTCPQTDVRIDLYMPFGFNKRLPDFAEVSRLDLSIWDI